MSYKVYHRMSDGTHADLCDELYETMEDADSAAQQAASDYSQGGDVLDLMGEEQGPQVLDWYIVEV